VRADPLSRQVKMESEGPREKLGHKFQREAAGDCNICGQSGPLHFDHVPPQGCGNQAPVEQQALFQKLISGHAEYKYTLSQNGVKYRTLCADCNSRLLGADLDPHLIAFARRLQDVINADLVLPRPVVHVRSNPARVARAVFGHLLAAKVLREETATDTAMRACIHDLDGPIPDELRLFFWVYPYGQITVMRDFVMPSQRGNMESVGFFSLMKFFPVGFLLANQDAYEGLQRFEIPDDPRSAEIQVNLLPVRHKDWPEMIDEGNFVIAGQSFDSAVAALPQRRKDRKQAG